MTSRCVLMAWLALTTLSGATWAVDGLPATYRGGMPPSEVVAALAAEGDLPPDLAMALFAFQCRATAANDAAAEAFESLLIQYPDSPIAGRCGVELGEIHAERVYKDSDDTEALALARQWYAWVVEHCPADREQCARASVRACYLEGTRQQWETGLEMVEKVLADYPEQVEVMAAAYREKGLFLQRMGSRKMWEGQRDEGVALVRSAAEACDAAIALEPEDEAVRCRAYAESARDYADIGDWPTCLDRVGQLLDVCENGGLPNAGDVATHVVTTVVKRASAQGADLAPFADVTRRALALGVPASLSGGMRETVSALQGAGVTGITADSLDQAEELFVGVVSRLELEGSPGETVTATFELVGTPGLQVTAIRSSKLRFELGDATQRYDAQPRRSAMRFTVRVTCLVPDYAGEYRDELLIETNAGNAPETTVALVLRVAPRIQLFPQSVILGVVDPSRGADATQRIAGLKDGDRLAVLFAPAFLSATLRNVGDEGGAADAELDVSLPADAEEEGELGGYVAAGTNVHGEQRLRWPVSGVVVGRPQN